ncbi:MAG: hypothetical protein CMD68_00645 [Gammaproteobacteria bacterium]|nr:hypothetical protein [Gammaproteobacteria bacterium]
MFLKDGYKKIMLLTGTRISNIDLVNKGSDGQKIMTAIGLTNDSRALDFIDGDLKTNKHLNGKPAETLWISQMQNNLTEFEKGLKFKDSWIYHKIKKFIYLPIDKTSDHIIGSPTIVSEDVFPELYKKLEEDFNFISFEIQKCIKNKEVLHTVNGPNNFLQIRTKAAKNKYGRYTPMKINGFEIKDKYMAFYFKKEFLYQIN